MLVRTVLDHHMLNLGATELFFCTKFVLGLSAAIELPLRNDPRGDYLSPTLVLGKTNAGDVAHTCAQSNWGKQGWGSLAIGGLRRARSY
ncbi:hypothetical protein U746_1101 [Mycolicibacterium mucogenicum 261Sha1.1M5]|nr:hypothetical protein [Leucobacter aridicollis]RKQ89857.1 hypothetical protein U746_1101 [Mycolicibacterium mucogenicum 261Sha1.1M5]